MIEHSAKSQDSAQNEWQSTPLTVRAVAIGVPDTRTSEKNVCQECGEHVHSHADSCPVCGESLVQSPKQIHCIYCHTPASSALVVCPGCGRELREAPPKLVTFGVPALLALLLLVLVVTQWERVSPIAWARTNLVRGVVLVEGLSASIEPEMVIVMTPIGESVAVSTPVSGNNSNHNDVVAVAIAAADNTLQADASLVTPIPAPDVTQDGDTPSLAIAVQGSPIGVGGPQANESSAESNVVPDSVPTEIAPATEVPLPTDTPIVPTATATFVPTEAPVVVEAVGVAANFGGPESARTSTPTWTAVATEASIERVLATVVATSTVGVMGGMAQVAALAESESVMPTPTATPTIAITPLPTPTATPVVYQVRAGDTLVTIAASYGVDVEGLMAANNISAQDVYVIQPGQMLFIPIPPPVGEPVIAAVGDISAVRLEAPALLLPTSDTTVGCATGGKLMWQRVQFIKDSDKYVLHLGFVDGQAGDGQENVVWVVAQSAPVTQNEWELDKSLCDLAPAESGHEWRWWVEVVEEVDGRTVPVSPPSEVRSFVWK